MSTVLAGVDESPSARDAVVLARALAGDVAELLLAAVQVEPRVPLPSGLRSAQPTREQLEQLVAAVCDDCAPRARTLTLRSRSPARALRELVEAEPARLVVLGSARRAQAGQAFAGRTVRQVLHGAPCAVALAARGVHEGGFALRRIVVGTDGSAEARAALEAACELAAREGAELRVVAVAEEALPVSRAPLGEVLELAEWEQVVARRKEHAERVLAEAVEVAGGPAAAGEDERDDAAAPAAGAAPADAPAPVGELRVGDPAEELAAAAADADLLVVGSRHWGPLSRVVVGSTAEELLRGAPCSLLLVPRPSEEAPPS